MVLRVLVTRPEPGASRTGARLAAAGFSPILMPMTEIVPLRVDEAMPTHADAVVATSANALRHCPPDWVAGLAGTPLFAVGAETGALARSLGFRDVIDGPGNALDLAGLAAGRLSPGASVVYLCGKVRLADFEHALIQHGMQVQPVETYDTRPVLRAAEDVLALLGREPVDAVLLYSVEAARAYERVFSEQGLAEMIASALHCCLSERVASGLEKADRATIRVAGAPTEDALFALLEGQSLDRTRPGLFSA
jgi:uroporphyrinogen-III synthase